MNYKSRRWKRKRENMLRRDGYKCKECIRYGRVTQANTVHHIKPVESHPELAFDNMNLISLCAGCHNKMHDRITNELTDIGLDLLDRTYRPTRI